MKTKLLILFNVVAVFAVLLFATVALAIDNTPVDATTRTITTGGTSQAVFAANSNRRYLLIQNQSDTDMYINFGAVAAAGTTSVKIIPGSSYQDNQNPPTTTVTIVCATTGKAFAAKQGGN